MTAFDDVCDERDGLRIQMLRAIRAIEEQGEPGLAVAILEAALYDIWPEQS